MRLKITNKQPNPTFVFTGSKGDGRQEIAAGAEYVGEFSDGEAANLRSNPGFDVKVIGDDGKIVSAEAATPDPRTTTLIESLGPIAKRVNSFALEDFPASVSAALDAGDASGKIVTAVSDKLRVPVDGIGEEIDRLTENEVSYDAFVAKVRDALGINDGVGILETINALKSKADAMPNGKMTLLQAVQSLDDANDAHWTQGGKPDLDTLKSLTGGDVTRAEVDSLVPPRTRKTA